MYLEQSQPLPCQRARSVPWLEGLEKPVEARTCDALEESQQVRSEQENWGSPNQGTPLAMAPSVRRVGSCPSTIT